MALAVFALPTANALAVGEGVKAKMEELKRSFPGGVDYRIAYDTTPFIEHSVHDVFVTIYIAAALVIVVVMFRVAVGVAPVSVLVGMDSAPRPGENPYSDYGDNRARGDAQPWGYLFRNYVFRGQQNPHADSDDAENVREG